MSPDSAPRPTRGPMASGVERQRRGRDAGHGPAAQLSSTRRQGWVPRHRGTRLSGGARGARHRQRHGGQIWARRRRWSTQPILQAPAGMFGRLLAQLPHITPPRPQPGHHPPTQSPRRNATPTPSFLRARGRSCPCAQILQRASPGCILSARMQTTHQTRKPADQHKKKGRSAGSINSSA